MEDLCSSIVFWQQPERRTTTWQRKEWHPRLLFRLRDLNLEYPYPGKVQKAAEDWKERCCVGVACDRLCVSTEPQDSMLWDTCFEHFNIGVLYGNIYIWIWVGNLN